MVSRPLILRARGSGQLVFESDLWVKREWASDLCPTRPVATVGSVRTTLTQLGTTASVEHGDESYCVYLTTRYSQCHHCCLNACKFIIVCVNPDLQNSINDCCLHSKVFCVFVFYVKSEDLNAKRNYNISWRVKSSTMLRLVGWHVDTHVRVKQGVRLLQVKAIASYETSATTYERIRRHVESSAVPLWEPQNLHLNNTLCFICMVDWVGVVGIATLYGLDGPGIESRWGLDFPHPSRPTLGPTQPPIQWVLGLFPGDKATGAWHWAPTSSSTEVKERVELYLCSLSDPSWSVVGWILPYLWLEMSVCCHISSEWA
jgi:hypothetical protein